MHRGTCLLALAALLAAGCAARGNGAAEPEVETCRIRSEVELGNGFTIQLPDVESFDNVEQTEHCLGDQPGIEHFRRHVGCEENHADAAVFYSVVPAVGGSCLPPLMREWNDLRDLPDWLGCESLHVGPLTGIGSAPDSVSRFDFSHDCLCPQGLPQVGRAVSRPAGLPGQCLMAAGFWPRSQDRTMSLAFERAVGCVTVSVTD
ncbi:hypothetical protein ACFL26_01550 [Patescibacteria group bacterium]